MFDALVVGARCGGAPTAMLLARKGYKVLLVDRAGFPSDIPTDISFIEVGPVFSNDGVCSRNLLPRVVRPSHAQLPITTTST